MSTTAHTPDLLAALKKAEKVASWALACVSLSTAAHVQMLVDRDQMRAAIKAAEALERRAAHARARRAFAYCVFPVSRLEFGGFAGVESPKDQVQRISRP